MSEQVRLIDVNKMAAVETEAYMEVQISGKVSPITQGINSVVHRKLQQFIADAPTVDAVEVVHGKLDNERVVEAIEQLSDIRAQYDYYNPDEIRKCHALTFAIVMLNDVLAERRSGDDLPI